MHWFIYFVQTENQNDTTYQNITPCTGWINWHTGWNPSESKSTETENKVRHESTCTCSNVILIHKTVYIYIFLITHFRPNFKYGLN